MPGVSLQDMIEDIRFDDLPANWTHFPNDNLILTYRDDLIEQLKAHVNEFNADEALWRRLEKRRRLRKKTLRHLT